MPRTLAVVVQPILKYAQNGQQLPNESDQEQYLKAYYEQYYKEWYRQHNEANGEADASSSPLPRRKIKIQFGKTGDYKEVSVQN
ncbi:unnamed protein product [Strongylus vulgaris]|uniref:Uncharacterized protein n=1 Tax=Strongylus vulgaris TaxID=40348 RepID=A0A3P7I8M1_STRVU|nr:unnamed protein product [Strongylus vulgaris]